MSGLELGANFKDWPENLPREDLVRLLRGYANECRKTEQILGAAFPGEFPLGDGKNFPTGHRLVEVDASEIATKAVAEIRRLRSIVRVFRNNGEGRHDES